MRTTPKGDGAGVGGKAGLARKTRGRAPKSARPAAKPRGAEFKRALPAPTHRALRLIGRLAESAGYRAYLVGGIVRDIALGYPDTDLDIVIEGRAEEIARRYARESGGIFKQPTEFGTCKVESGALGTIDFAGARTETYRKPGALPVVELSDLERDLWRRDFTVNAMALCLNPRRYGVLEDPCGGLGDLRRSRLRVMHRASFADDPTRVLRGVRFAARYGFGFEPRTRALARACIDGGGLATVSGKRVCREISLICAEPTAGAALRMLARYGVLREVLGAGWRETRCAGIWRALGTAPIEGGPSGAGWSGGGPVRPWVCWMASLFAGLAPESARKAGERFNLPRDVREVCLWAAAGLARARRLLEGGHPDPYRVRRALDAVPGEALVLVWASSPGGGRRALADYLGRWSKVTPELSGGEIAALGCGPGPQVGRVRDAILRLKLAGKLVTREDEIAYAKRRTAPAARRGRGNRC